MTIAITIQLFDLMLCGALVFLAVQTLAVRDLFRAIITYIVFGLSLALVWARLKAPDVALAEAAIGAGLTGALLLTTVAAIVSAAEQKP